MKSRTTTITGTTMATTNTDELLSFPAFENSGPGETGGGSGNENVLAADLLKNG